MAITAFKRYEMKFMLTQAQLDTLIPKLLEYMNPDDHCQNGKEYSIYNLYYDTSDHNLIRHSLSKPYYKEKLRLRSYFVPTSSTDKVFLELKKKIGGIVNKRRAVLTLKEADDFINFGKRPVTMNTMTQQVVNEIEYFLSHNDVAPAVYISYKRLAFFGKADKDFRVTFDYDITTRRTELRLEKASYGEQLLDKGKYLMEVKISSAVPMWLSKILSNLFIYRTGFSKYGQEYQNACLHLYPSQCVNY
ncbi:polyphosphate polymerase domain-containing protein [Desulfosporosinus shakirovi]|uniref:polyphosphate polymerase domain-containing protein n=1 Tax=Desulfosporosinus shakirovi TaxID=2885154 RepID=UPI001E368C72|nr:polyphosphate polymerase domain-containing protein [Desulfosporosinus sp. SRJS8]MCB8815187.1 polyphosphate polymerase domain-containing protein [Desulfosporosinus sp. SRJS8]